MKHFSHSQAVAAITAGLTSQAIKLRGANSSGHIEDAEENAKIDAQYLVTLLTQLQGAAGSQQK